MDHASPSTSDKQPANSARTTPFSFLLENEAHSPALMLPAAHAGVPVFSRRPLLSGSVVEWAVVGAGALVVLVGAWSVVMAGAGFMGDRLHISVPSADLMAGPTFSASSLAASSVPLSGVDTASTTVQNGILPTHIIISAIGVNADVTQVGKNAKGNMGAPADYKTVAWYSLASRPGAPGSAVMAGHLNNSLSTAGVFANIDKLKHGDLIVVSDADGHTRTFSVVASEVYPADQAPDNLIFTSLGPSQLALITCDGAWNKGQKSFDQRLVVFARLTSSS